jgi:hypothetical protein
VYRVLDQSVKVNITHDRERLIVKGNEFRYLGFNEFRLSCLAEKCLTLSNDCSIYTADIVG